ncbi:hypothetical protein [Methanobrevibacter sp.]|uniref:hypothetical protein n=1 Tax=Methanobrevibacter sp. TaxID=66852 RepID=UPI002E77BBBA|nr:hypothetical protein [Methanobrevibacter sp.]MEE1335597.1 hypothetical protein [Methanobrevibacter sp.]
MQSTGSYPLSGISENALDETGNATMPLLKQGYLQENPILELFAVGGVSGLAAIIKISNS